MAVGAFLIPFVADFFSLQIPSARQFVPILAGALAGAVGVVLVARNQDRIADTAVAIWHRARR
jgi:hypothetical protein